MTILFSFLLIANLIAANGLPRILLASIIWLVWGFCIEDAGSTEQVASYLLSLIR